MILYVFLESMRRAPVKEEKLNRGSSILIVAALTWMIITPTIIHLFVHVWRLPPFAMIVGILVGIAGVWVRFSAIAMLGRFYSRNVGIQEKHELIQTGWYRFVRHPGYLGTLLTFLGFAFATESWLSVIINVVLFFIVYLYRIKVEETALVSHFGDSYRRYQEKTWRLIPFIY